MGQQFKTSPADAGRRLDQVVASHLSVSRNKASRLIDNGLVMINGVRAKASRIMEISQLVVVDSQPLAHAADTSALVELPVLYQDKDVIIIDKPAGLLAHAGHTAGPQPSVAARAAALGVVDVDMDRPGIVHRLDKDTSGVMVLARHPLAKGYMQKLFADRRVQKNYICLVSGRMKNSEARIELPIGRNKATPVKQGVVSGGRAAVTEYRVAREYAGVSLLEVGIKTGRTHQIRVHLSHLGHPVVGDKLYANVDTRKLPKIHRQFLHAAQIKFIGPSGQHVDVSSPLPAGLADYLRKLQD